MLLPWICTLILAFAPGPLESGWLLLDAGRNAEAVRCFADLYATEPRPATARGLAEALRRQCLLQDEMELFAGDPPLPAAAYAAAMALGATDRPGPAVPAFEHALELALAAGDSLSAAAAGLDGAECALRAGRFSAADSLAVRAITLGDALGRLRTSLAGRVLSAGVHNFNGRFAVADSIYAAVLDQAQTAGLTAIACDALNGRGAVASRQRRTDDSRRHYRTALGLARQLGDRRRRLRVLVNLGYDHTQARDTDAAREVLAEAFTLADSCPAFDDMRGHMHTGLGAAYETDGDRDRAVEQFRLAAATFTRRGDDGGELGARQRLAFNLMMSGNYSEAVSHYDTCLEIIDRRDSPHIINWVLAGLALTHHKLGNLDRAEHYYRRAMDQNEIFGDRMSMAWCRLSLGLLDVLRGDYSSALAHNHAALKISIDLADTAGIGEAHSSLADVHFRLGDWDTALAEYEQAVAIARQHDLEELLRAAITGLASLGRAAGRPDLVQEYCETALDIARRWQDSTAQIWALTELAEQNLAMDDIEAARIHLDEAGRLLQPAGQYAPRSRILLLQARCARQPAAALALANEALASAETGGLPESEWACLTARGTWRLALGDTTGALADQAEAVRIVESLRRNVGHDELRRHMLRPALIPYERIIDLLAGSDGSEGALAAFAYAERSRAQILADRLRAALAGRDQGSVADSAGQRDILAAIVHQQARLQDPSLTPSERATARQRVAELETDYMVLRLGSIQANAGPAAYATIPPRPEDLLAIPREDERVVSFFLGTERSWLFEIADGAIRAHPLPSRRVIEDLVRRYLALCEAPTSRPKQIRTAARRLHDLILGSLADEGAGTLIIIPDGLLHRLPFAALPGADGPLIADCRVFTAPSLQSLAYLRQRADRHSDQSQTRPLVVTLGHGGHNGGVRLHPYAGRPFAPLLHAEDEARDVAALFADSRVLLGRRATESALAAAPLHRAAILHLAVHGDVDDRDVSRSFLLLEQNDPAGGDGLLQWGEAATLDLDASLVTLASCRSARGVLAVGEGITGLTQAFLFAGGSCVLAAQADIDDSYSRSFMLDFYRHLRDGDTAAGALRKVQLSAAATDSSGRAHWADFVLVGDGAVTLPPGLVAGHGGRGRTVVQMTVTGVALVLIGLLGWWIRRRRANSVSSAQDRSPTV
ncbi:hypothetical protein DRQ50_05200 [bacterium]|nr:MAG: hypothetical protein DRQ50_05200 [bacterium]